MGHKLVKSLIVPKIIELIMQKYKLSNSGALDMFYKSSTAQSLDDDDTGLYGQSALYIFSLFEGELESNNNRISR